jgi:hypothetical protein
VEEGLEGEVVRVDRFGNLISNIPEPALMDILQGRRPKIQAGNMIITQLSETYADAAPDGPLALIGSSGFLEISVNGGRAADRAFPDCESALGALVWVKPLPNTGLRDD